MPGTKEIKRRIKSVKSTKKITKAMELVAASKMKRSVSATLASRLYANYSWDLLLSLSSNLKENKHPFFEENLEIKKTLVVLITSNRGLCGAYNAQSIKKILSILKNKKEDEDIDIITVGKKGDSAMRRLKQNIIASFLELPDHITLQDIRPLSEMITRSYKEKKYKNITIIYTDFISALSQKATRRTLLPISKEELKETIDSLSKEKIEVESKNIEYKFEGDTDILIEKLSEKLTRMQIYQMLLESNASEQSSRMMAMKNASEAAGEMIHDLTMAFNKARQANITREISEISAGMASVS